MKRNYFLPLLLSFFALSCSNDDDAAGDDPINDNPDIPANYIPLSNGDYWVYNVEGATTLNGRDSLYVSGDTLINSISHKKLRTLNMPLGFYSASLSNNGIRKEGSKLIISGATTSGIPELPVEIDLANFIIFDGQAADGNVLSSTTGNMQQSVQGFALDIQYTLSSVAGENFENYSAPDGTAYNNVKKVSVRLSMQVTATPEELPIPFIILPLQDVIISSQYYAEGIGMVHSETDMEYQLSGTFGVELPIPQTMSQHQEEVLDNYQIN